MTDYSGQILADKYRVDSLLREGVLGDLYRATHLAMEKPVVVKILPAALAVDDVIAERFRSEAKTLSRLQHPNITGVSDYGTDASGTAFIVYENAAAADGGSETLKQVVARDGQFSLERANRITRQIAAALAVAHAGGVIHQNLTSENVVLTKSAAAAAAGDEAETVKVLNFGTAATAATAADDGLAFDELTAQDAEYLSPEQCTQTGAADARSDVYSLGVILYEMLAGEVPFSAPAPNDVMLKHAQEPPLPLSAFRMDLPNEVSEILLTALAKNPDARFQTASDFAAALNRATLAASSGAGAAAATVGKIYPNLSKPVGAAAVAEETPQNNIWKTAFIVLAGVAVLSGFFIYLTQVKQTNPPTQLQTDANGQPVQPVNPPAGTSEQSLSNMGAYSPEMLGNSNLMTNGAQLLPGGDGYDAWRNGVRPPPGGTTQDPYGTPTYIPPPTGQMYDGNVNSTSPFMQDGNTYILVPKNSNTNAATNTAQPKKTPPAGANANTAQPANTATKPAPTPAANTNPPPAAATPKNTKPTPKPTAAPKPNSTQKGTTSGKELET